MRTVTPVVLLALALVACSDPPHSESDAAAKPTAAVHSQFGVYESPDATEWDGTERSSSYVPADDGTRLAVDVFLPTRRGAGPTGPLPTVLHYTRYVRAIENEDGSVSAQGENDPILKHLLRHGYAVAVADARGTGASYGVHHGEFSVEETRDSYAIIEWLAKQPWSNGRIGMAGRSYPGMTQYQAATQAPPALKAIFPEMAGPSAYDFVFSGGAFKQDFVQQWSRGTRAQDQGEAGLPARVDEDVEGVLRSEALAQHADNLWAEELFEQPGSGFRDFSHERSNGEHWDWERVIATIDDAKAIAASGVGIYHLIGWYDIYTTQQAWMFATLKDFPIQKMLIGPWVHGGGYGGTVHKSEILRWYDYWLKGIDNGVLAEPRIHYYVMRGNHTLTTEVSEAKPTPDEDAAEVGSNWLATNDWPPSAEATTFWLDAGRSETIDSVNDGLLSPSRPTREGDDTYRVNYASQVGSFSRWMNGYGRARSAPEGSTLFDERSAEDAKALTYTSAPMTEDTTIAGYPIVELSVTSNQTDGDYFAYLEEIDDSGRAHYVSEGVLRASHRKTSKPPFDNLGVPYHRSYAEDLMPLAPGERAQLAFDLLGTATVIDAGHRIRLTIAGADAANFALYPDPEGRDAPTVNIHLGGDSGSRLTLPIVDR